MNKPADEHQNPDQTVSMPFRRSYIILPVAAAVLTILLTVIFYWLLPEQVAYRLQDDPGTLIGRGALAAWLIIPQVIFTLGSFGLVKMVLSAARYATGDSSLIPRIIPLVGNMTAIIQVVILLAAVQIFLYNAYEITTGPLWVPAVSSWSSAVLS
jgi:hypothetical protein